MSVTKGLPLITVTIREAEGVEVTVIDGDPGTTDDVGATVVDCDPGTTDDVGPTVVDCDAGTTDDVADASDAERGEPGAKGGWGRGFEL